MSMDEKILANALADLKPAPVPRSAESEQGTSTTDASNSDRSADPMRLTTLADLMVADLNDEVEWLVPSLLPKVGCAFVAAPPKHLKSWLLLDLLLAVTDGGEFLGRETSADEDATVLYLAGEGRASALRWRLKRLLSGREIHSDNIAARIHLSICPNIMLNDDLSLSVLRAALDGISPTPSLLVIDPLTRLHSADENSRNEVEPMLTALRRLSEDYQTLIVLAHHSRKANAHGRDPLRGSSSFRGWHDALIWLEPKSGDETIRELNAELRDAEPFGPIHIKLSVSDIFESAEIEITEAPKRQDAAQKRADKVIEFLLDHPGPQKESAIRELFNHGGTVMKNVRDNITGKNIDGVRIEATQDKGAYFLQAIQIGEQGEIDGC